MLTKTLIVTGLALGLAVPAMAQQSSQSGAQTNPNAQASASGQNSSGGSQNSSGNSQSTPHNAAAIQQQVKQDLEQAGFSQVQVMPQSFLVRAQDKRHNPVMMLINPDSVTAVTALNTSDGNSQQGASGKPAASK